MLVHYSTQIWEVFVNNDTDGKNEDEEDVGFGYSVMSSTLLLMILVFLDSLYLLLFSMIFSHFSS